jgi:hypothetical protein
MAWAVEDEIILADTGEGTYFGKMVVTGKDLRTLSAEAWLNDEIVNYLLAGEQKRMSQPTGNA